MQTLSGNQRPDLLTALMNMSFVPRLPRKMHLCRFSSNVPHLPSFLEIIQNPHVLLTLDKVHNPTTPELPKVARTCGVFNILTSKCASRHNGVHFFDIATSKSGPNMASFVHFDLEMCFAPQRRALFRHLNSQRRVHFFDTSTSKSGPDLVCFVHFDFEMCFSPQWRAIFHLSSAQRAPHPPLWRAYFYLRSDKTLEKQSVSRLSYLFARLVFFLLRLSLFGSSFFFLLLFSSLTLPTAAFHLSILSEV